MITPHPAKPRETPLRRVHERLGATMTDFAGWLMPLRYRSETAEHLAVRASAGLFDLSHMGEIAVRGPGAAGALDYALIGDASAIPPGRARYTMICAADGGILDDLIVYRLAGEEFLVVANAANTPVVLTALRDRAAGHDAQVADDTDGYALIALQGPAAAGILAPLASAGLDGLRYYASQPARVAGHEVLLARTGYTGEDGFELFAAPADAEPLWAALSSAGRRGGAGPGGPGRPGHPAAGSRHAAVRQRARARGDPLPGRPGPGGQARTSPAISSAAPRWPRRPRRHPARCWPGCAPRPAGCPGTVTPCCGTASRAGR